LPRRGVHDRPRIGGKARSLHRASAECQLTELRRVARDEPTPGGYGPGRDRECTHHRGADILPMSPFRWDPDVDGGREPRHRLEREAEIGCGLKAVFTILLETASHDALDAWRNLANDLTELRWLFLQNRRERVGRGCAVEWLSPGGAL